MSKYIIGLCILFANISMVVQAQNCGTKIPDSYTDILKKRIALKADDAPDPLQIPDINLSISVYIAGSYMDPNEVLAAVDSLNIAFQPIGVSFSMCSFDTVTEADYASVSSTRNEEELRNHYNSPHTINLYLADQLVSDSEVVCGYAYLPVSPLMNYIFIDKSCNMSKTLIHEMGHFFGLLHPHEEKFGKELADGSNCGTAGDLICDTDASPELSSLVDANCEYSGQLTDENGNYYLPSVANYMSYAPNDCRCSFTPEQYQRMLQFYWAYLTSLR